MKIFRKILVLVFCIVITALAGTAAAQQEIITQPCTCLDESGMPYVQRPADNTLCYQFTKDKQQLVLVETLTYRQCELMNNAWLQQQEQLRQQAEEEARQKAAAEEAARKAAAEEAARKAAEEEAARKAAEEEAARIAAEEETARIAAEEEAARIAAEEEAARIAAEEEAARKAVEEAAQKAAEEAAAQKAAEETDETKADAVISPVNLSSVSETRNIAAVPLQVEKIQAIPDETFNETNSSNNEDDNPPAVIPVVTGANASSEEGNGLTNSSSPVVPVVVEGKSSSEEDNGLTDSSSSVVPVIVEGKSSSEEGNGLTDNSPSAVPVVMSGTSSSDEGNGLTDNSPSAVPAALDEIPDTEPQIRSLNKIQTVTEESTITASDSDDLLISPQSNAIDESKTMIPVMTVTDSEGKLLSKSNADEDDPIQTSDDTLIGNADNSSKKDVDAPVDNADDSSKKDGDAPVDDVTEDDKPEVPQSASALSEGAFADLKDLLSDEELQDLQSVIDEKWLDENAADLSEETLKELAELDLTEEALLKLDEILSSQNSAPVLFKSLNPSVSIEGSLNTIQLVSPDGGTVTTGMVPLEWNYTYDEKSASMEVQFQVSMTIVTEKDKVTLTTTVSSVACSKGRCTYTADLSQYKKASVTWDVTGFYENGSTIETVKSKGPRTFTLDIPDPTPTPTSTPTPTATPTPAPKPKPKAPVQECPKGRYTVRNLGFYWAPSENAEKYLVEWRNDKGQKGSLSLSNTDVTCQNNRCIVSTTLPGTGQYAWTVTAINSSGSARSGEMKFEIAANITTPQAYRPDGTIVNRTYPSFEWEDVRDGAIEYRIQVVGKYDSRIRMDRWYSVKDIYVGKGICYVKTDLFLPAGTYSWRVQARNKDFASGWSSWRDFYVECDYCNYNNVYYNNYANTVPSCSYPVGTITVNKPEFQWRTLTGASYYMVKLLDSSGQTLFENQVSSSNCTIELCKWTPNYTLTKNGNYTWSVAGYGGNGALWNIAYGSFTYQGAAVMKAISYLRPAQNGYLTNEAPVILWTDPGEGAALFHIEIFNNANTLLFSADLNREQAWCDGNTCSIEFKTIPDAENYRITVTPYSEFNTKGDMISLVFSKGGKVLKLSSPKGGAVVSSRPLFRWPLEYSESTSYELILTDAQNNVTTISPLVCGAVGVTCEEGEVFYSPASALPAGTYTVKLAVVGANALSEEVRITVK